MILQQLDVDNFDFIHECVVFCRNVPLHKQWGSKYKKLNYGQNIVKTYREFKTLVETQYGSVSKTS